MRGRGRGDRDPERRGGQEVVRPGVRPPLARDLIMVRDLTAGQRPLTRAERIEARHWLQQLTEQARQVRDAMDPAHGMHTVTVQSWAAQWESLGRALDDFTHRVVTNKPSPGGITDRNA